MITLKKYIYKKILLLLANFQKAKCKLEIIFENFIFQIEPKDTNTMCAKLTAGHGVVVVFGRK